MKLIAYSIALSMLLIGGATAQPPGRGIDIERMAVLLDLDDYQKGEVQRILEEQRSAAGAARQAMQESGERPPREEMMARRQQAAEDMRTQLQSVLTQDQLEKFEVLMERPRGEGRRGRPRSDE